MDKEILSALISVGLNESQAKVYAYLKAHGECQTGVICEGAGVRSSHIYSVLENLKSKGLVNYKIVNNIKVFTASNPESLAHLYEEKEKKIKEEKIKVLQAISQLKTSSVLDQRTNFKFFSGIKGIRSLFTEIMNSWHKGDTYYVSAVAPIAFEHLEPFFLDFHKKRVKDKVNLRFLIDFKSNEFGKIREKMSLAEVRYINLDASTEFGVLNDYFLLTCYGQEPYGLLIKDNNMAETYRKYFEILWKIAKK